MKLVSFGDSFMFGTDLSDDAPDYLPGAKKSWLVPCSKSTWPALLASHYQAEYLCCAYPGVGNFFILREITRILAEEKNKEDLLFCIGWTWIDRFDYLGPNSDFIWSTVRPSLDQHHVDSHYYRHLHNELTDKFHSLTWISQAIYLLEQAKVNYVMTMIDDLVFDKKFHCPCYVEHLQNSVSDHITRFDGLDFLSWAKKQDYPVSANGHPLEDAHRAACDYIIQNIPGR
jgi:hypothetical protein